MKRDKILVVILGCLIIAAIAIVSFQNKIESSSINKINEYSSDYINKQVEKQEQEKKDKTALIEKYKGVVCWGGSNTAGNATSNYVDFLYNTLKDSGFDLPVKNYGVLYETSMEILARQGSQKATVGEDTQILETQSALNQMKIVAFDGSEINLLAGKDNPGINPCTINGVEGTLYGQTSVDAVNKTSEFYFQRTTEGERMQVKAGTKIETEGSSPEYKEYINVFWLEEGWNSTEELIEQEQMLASSTFGKYIVMAPLSCDENQVERLKEIFGNKLIDTRAMILEGAKEVQDGSISEVEKKAVAEGKIPESFMNNNGLFNKTIDEIIGKKVCQKIIELGYLE